MSGLSAAGCGKCVCRSCLLWWSCRCPYGSCYDDHRAKTNPYDVAHPNKPPRTWWSNWKTDQAFWCRGGFFYPTDHCDHYVPYKREETIRKECLIAPVTVYQDGFIHCTLVDSIGCEECLRRFEAKAMEEDCDGKNH